MTYRPQPIDTSDITLSPSLGNLMEKLARNAHDIWARQRMADGWSHGSRRDDEKKTHPCLVDYADLPESEKQYDRNAASETLKSIIKLGYGIVEPRKTPAAQLDAETLSLAASIRESARQLDMQGAATLWLGRDRKRWQQYPDIYLGLGKRVLSLKEPLLAFDILSEGIEAFGVLQGVGQAPTELHPTYITMQQQRALALAESGAAREANRIMLDLENRGLEDGETLGILGRTFKDLAKGAPNDQEHLEHFRHAHERYRRAYTLAWERQMIDDAYYNGINAATMALLAHMPDESAELAVKVKDICEEMARKAKTDGKTPPYWLTATLGEAELLLGRLENARTWYQAAATHGDTGVRERVSMRRQARLILKKQGLNPDLLDSCFGVPSVVIFDGHMTEAADHPKNVLSVQEEERVRLHVRQKLESMGAGVGYGSAACERDILFLEEMAHRGAEINIVLPVEKDRFREMIKSSIPGVSWLDRFDGLVEKAARVWALTRYDPLLPTVNLEFARLFLLGMARSRAQMLGTQLQCLSFGDTCRSEHPQSREDRPGPARQKDGTPRHTCRIGDTAHYHLYLPMMFSDVKGYGRLTDDELVYFATRFLPRLQEVLAKHGDGILSRRTQGDSQFLVFKDISTAVRVALEQRSLLERIDWTQYGLPGNLAARFSLDAGPCYSFRDPIVERLEFCGAYVNRAARIEPITPPGHIYASETFVALARATEMREAHFDYVGQVILPKSHGIIPVYHVRESLSFIG